MNLDNFNSLVELFFYQAGKQNKKNIFLQWLNPKNKKKFTWEETEKNIKNDTNATIRCIPFNQENTTKIKCIFSNKPAKYEVIFAKAY